MNLLIQKQLNGDFRVCYDSDLEKAKKLKVNQTYNCKITQPRNVSFHRKFFALINMIYSNQEHYNNIDRLRKDLIIEAGFYEEWTDLHGEVQTEAKSISFSSMKQDEFDELYNRVLDQIVKHFNFDKQDIIDNVTQYF